jgi:plasmid maintenance system antidote protein VapI
MHIGEMIKEEVEHQERTVSWLAKKISCNRQNVYSIYKRNTIDTDLLMRISTVLDRDFFDIYCKEFKHRMSERKP